MSTSVELMQAVEALTLAVADLKPQEPQLITQPELDKATADVKAATDAVKAVTG